jgi:hypothetical protein
MPTSHRVQKLCKDSRGQYRRIIARRSRLESLPGSRSCVDVGHVGHQALAMRERKLHSIYRLPSSEGCSQVRHAATCMHASDRVSMHKAHDAIPGHHASAESKGQTTAARTRSRSNTASNSAASRGARVSSRTNADAVSSAMLHCLPRCSSGQTQLKVIWERNPALSVPTGRSKPRAANHSRERLRDPDPGLMTWDSKAMPHKAKFTTPFSLPPLCALPKRLTQASGPELLSHARLPRLLQPVVSAGAQR